MKNLERANPLGASLRGPRCEFRVWAPEARQVELVLTRAVEDQKPLAITMRAEADGYFAAETAAAAGDHYFYRVEENKPVPDPVSRLLPLDVHGPTEIIDPGEFTWSDHGWRGVELSDYILYELHVGTFTPEGAFDGVIRKLDYLKNTLGVTVIELMPVAAFPGKRNWGYDAVSPYAVQASYGGPHGLKRLVDAAHRAGLGVMLDVVYNHLGHEGNYLRMFGPYFTRRHQTPWGDAINFDGAGSEGVRRYFVENALYWVREYHMDGLRLDAVQTIFDDSPKHILREIQENVRDLASALQRSVCVIAESDGNNRKLVSPISSGGYGLDAFWSDDFHHAIHAVLTGERDGYYQDFGLVQQIAQALSQGYVFQGEFFHYWNAPRGTPASGIALPKNVTCIQNHDQVGNRAKGERLTELVSTAGRKAAAALLLLAPHTPLLFMGQEYDETAPFQFFTSFGDPGLAEAVRKGRREEFKQFPWEEIPDPQDEETFVRSRLNWELTNAENEMLIWYRQLIGLRKKYVTPGERSCFAQAREGILTMLTPKSKPLLKVVARLGNEGSLAEDEAGWERIMGSEDGRFAVEVFLAEGLR